MLSSSMRKRRRMSGLDLLSANPNMHAFLDRYKGERGFTQMAQLVNDPSDGRKILLDTITSGVHGSEVTISDLSRLHTSILADAKGFMSRLRSNLHTLEQVEETIVSNQEFLKSLHATSNPDINDPSTFAVESIATIANKRGLDFRQDPLSRINQVYGIHHYDMIRSMGHKVLIAWLQHASVHGLAKNPSFVAEMERLKHEDFFLLEDFDTSSLRISHNLTLESAQLLVSIYSGAEGVPRFRNHKFLPSETESLSPWVYDPLATGAAPTPNAVPNPKMPQFSIGSSDKKPPGKKAHRGTPLNGDLFNSPLVHETSTTASDTTAAQSTNAKEDTMEL